MNRKEWIEGLLFAGFRLMSTGCIITGLIGMLFQLTTSWQAFDPSYLGAFLAATVLRPLLLMIVGAILHMLSAGLAKRMASRFTHS